MAVIILSEDGDQTASTVVEWIHYKNRKVYRLNSTCKIILNSLQLSSVSNFIFEYNEGRINLDSVEAFWHRNGNFSFDFPKLNFSNDFAFRDDFCFHIQHEQRKLREYLAFKLQQKTCLGDIFKANVNKLIILEKARAANIKIPDTLVTSKKSELVNFRAKYKDIICKPVSEGVMAADKDIGIIIYYTSVMKYEDVDKLKDKFAVSLFQEKIEKKIELRIFYLKGEFYAMAIFSQADKQTAIDFRRYNLKKPNRTVPYNLPLAVQNQLRKLMCELNLDIGSIDMAINQNNEYVFFEVNPVGQIGMTSQPCNFFLEKKIANYLIQNGKPTTQN